MYVRRNRENRSSIYAIEKELEQEDQTLIKSRKVFKLADSKFSWKTLKFSIRSSVNYAEASHFEY